MLPHSFFSLWLIPLISIYFSFWLCRLSTWGWIWWASVSLFWLSLCHSCLSGGIYPTNWCRMAHFHQSRHLLQICQWNVSVHLSPSEVVTVSELHLTWNVGWFYFFRGWYKSISFDSLPSGCSYFVVFFFVLTGFLWEFHICHRVCARVCVFEHLSILFFFHCPGWSFHLFSLLLCTSASFLFSLPFFLLYLIDRKTLSLCCY